MAYPASLVRMDDRIQASKGNLRSIACRGQDRPIPASRASCEAGQASAPEDTTCGKPDGGISRASLAGAEAQHTSNQAVFPGPLHRDRKKAHRAVTREAKADGDDEAGPPLAKSGL
ncbi:hypothetical protein DL764_009651 [Monosporascus ibericus]|uniref:Nsp2 transmembrane domain-containing protein n=1 Tax=Monosporascus ibericus TaxID=155417 RepID=A0A4Q4SXI8_9PEZI|nr:hypothetical protein DL764_009651 [Monosporascus ibericus]